MLSSSVDPFRPLLIYLLIVSTVAVTTEGCDKQAWNRPIKAAHTVSYLLGNEQDGCLFLTALLLGADEVKFRT